MSSLLHSRVRAIRAALASLFAGVAWASPAGASTDPCQPQTFEGQGIVVCTVKPGETDLRLFWQGADGEPYRRFSSLAKAVADDGRSLRFAINAGMYAKDFSPIGLYVEDGQRLKAANTQTIDAEPAKVPNFYKQPNGVFYLDDAGAGVASTTAFLTQRRAVRFATQSGPMLVIDGALHPAFIAGSTDRTRRSGVGVCRDGVVQFAISEAPINFHDFARLFRDHLHCPNALFLDGGRGAGIYAPALGRNDRSWHGGFGPMLGVVQ
ncbi:phosphodiester glycosidase family protein [Achromobacter sp. GG226]|uniref:phosphodiester glycosidase family protein n=1 Tax=Verticiella alkaliphila TaxID=2779529 RepID=UPI001C0B8AC1|nr:phosphodiester glycosidase family protein [Verticiella sp. GG226]MBU4611301.1 phosphodiester glycosidase family protein [Verticiella sp. GG226]